MHRSDPLRVPAWRAALFLPVLLEGIIIIKPGATVTIFRAAVNPEIISAGVPLTVSSAKHENFLDLLNHGGMFYRPERWGRAVASALTDWIP